MSQDNAIDIYYGIENGSNETLTLILRVRLKSDMNNFVQFSQISSSKMSSINHKTNDIV